MGVYRYFGWTQTRRTEAMQLILVRHGATAWSAVGRHTGETDVPLSGEGETQALSARGAIHHLLSGQTDTVRVYASPLQRAFRTAEIVCGDLFDIESDPRLIEMDYGDYEGLTTIQIRELHPHWDLWLDGCPGGEAVIDVGRRVDGFLKTLDDDATTLIFAHGHLLRVLAARVLGLSASDGRIFEIDPATVSIIGDRRGHKSITVWNADASSLPDHRN